MKLLGFNITREQRANPENPKFSLSDTRILDALGIGDGGVSPDSALRSAAVFASVRVLAESIAQLPIRLFRKKPDGTREQVTVHPLLPLITRAPNAVMTRITWMEQQTAQLALWGSAYSRLIIDRNTLRPREIFPLKSSAIAPELRETKDSEGYPTLRKVFKMNNSYLSDADVLHVPLMTLDGVNGLSPITMNRSGIALSLNQQQFASSFYEQGTKLSGVLEHPNKLSPEAAERLRGSFRAAYGGPNNAGKVAVLEEGMKFSALSMPLDDAQFIETMKFSREQIAAMFRVPPHMIGHLDRATFSNIEQQSLEFAVYTLGPYLVKWEQALNSLLYEGEREEYYFRFNLDALLRGDIKSRYDAYAVARNWGWLSVNDIMELEDRSPIPDGNVYLQPLNMTKAGTPANENHINEAGHPADENGNNGSASDA